ncbi:hypothetical protein ACYZUD_27160 [Pseudomonas sp. XS1P51]
MRRRSMPVHCQFVVGALRIIYGGGTRRQAVLGVCEMVLQQVLAEVQHVGADGPCCCPKIVTGHFVVADAHAP